MPELAIKITLLEDVVVNERPANEGGHKGLDYLPGYLLLGAAAARLYEDCSREDAWRLFHSGQVQFGNALPLAEGHPVWPMPLCWHEAKDDSAIRDGTDYLARDRVFNLQRVELPEEKQPKQLREGYVRADGYRLTVERSFRMKTAIHPDTGRVAESQLFGYESINAGQSFVARVSALEDFPAELWERLTKVFDDGAEVLLGRSRSAEYGRARIHAWTSPPSALDPAPGAADGNETVLWCLSDLALLDEHGQPTLKPSARALGLTRGAIDWTRSYLRFRRYAVWNQHREGYDLERQVIRQGSVIALTGLDAPLTDAERAMLAAGVGLHREAGLGRVCVDAKLLVGERPDFAPRFETPGAKDAKEEGESRTKPNSPLIVWLERRNEGDKERQAAERASQALRKTLKQCYANARKFAGVPEHLPIGPSPAQWGTLYEAARVADSGNAEKLRERLFNGENALCKPKGEGWQDEFRADGGKDVISFYRWFERIALPGCADKNDKNEKKEKKEPNPAASPDGSIDKVQTLRLFLREAQRVAQREHGRSDPKEGE